MSSEATVPPDLLERIRQIAAEEVQKYARSGPLRNARITGGAGLTIAEGGALRLESADGDVHAYIGGVGPVAPDGNLQPAVVLYREDGTIALAIFDPAPDAPDGYRQFLALYDRAQNIIVSDDTNSGVGLARPYVPAVFHRTRFADMSVSTTSATFETLWLATLYKQHPTLTVGARATMDTSATTGEVRVLVNGVQMGNTSAVGFAVTDYTFGPNPVAGQHLSTLNVEIQGRRTSASGALRVEPRFVYGLQT